MVHIVVDIWDSVCYTSYMNDTKDNQPKPLVPCSSWYHMCRQYADVMGITIEEANTKLSADIARVQGKDKG